MRAPLPFFILSSLSDRRPALTNPSDLKMFFTCVFGEKCALWVGHKQERSSPSQALPVSHSAYSPQVFSYSLVDLQLLPI